jgi:hypothetical protein
VAGSSLSTTVNRSPASPCAASAASLGAPFATIPFSRYVPSPAPAVIPDGPTYVERLPPRLV